MTDVLDTVLVHDGPVARAYLAAMAGEGIRPDRIVHIVDSTHPRTGKPFGRWMPATLRVRLLAKVHGDASFYWSRRLRLAHPELVAMMAERGGALAGFGPGIVDELYGTQPLGRYADHVEQIVVSGLDDPTLAAALSAIGPAVILFTGGGILPKRLLSTPGQKLLHVHPGFLPHVRGSDGVLWSYLVRGRPGASAFYMAPAIDAGDVVAAREFEAVDFPLPLDDRPDDTTLYRAVYSFFDPILRARTLLDVLKGGTDLSRLPGEPQDLGLGVTYHFQNAAIRAAALRCIFPDA